jgi:hypothetical protein
VYHRRATPALAIGRSARPSGRDATELLVADAATVAAGGVALDVAEAHADVAIAAAAKRAMERTTTSSYAALAFDGGRTLAALRHGSIAPGDVGE